MSTMHLGTTALEVSRIGQGCMRLSSDPAVAVATIRAALDAGIRFFDHADIYGRGERERTFSAVWREFPGLRSQIVIQSKCGIRFAGDTGPNAPKRFDFSYEHILASVEGSLHRLGTDYLDILLLHRPDALVEPAEVARAFSALYQQDKVRYFGVSNHTPGQIELLRRWVDQPIVANQLQLSIAHTHLIDEGLVMNRADWPTPLRGEGTLDYCRLHDITIQAWTPLAAGMLTGKPLPETADPSVARTASLVAELAADKGVSREAIAIAWLLRHPAGIQPIIGTTNPSRIQAACQADGVTLSREEWYRLLIAGRGQELP